MFVFRFKSNVGSMEESLKESESPKMMIETAVNPFQESSFT